MKKLTIAFSFLILAGAAVHAQDLKKARSEYNKTLLPGAKPEFIENAKVEVDKLITDPKTSGQAESQLLKMQLYSKIVADSNLLAKYPDADIQAYAALKKYLELEPTEEKLKADRYAGVNEIYGSFFKRGFNFYNAKDWDRSFDNFKLMAEMGDILVARKWTNSPFDTTSYLYAGSTAQNAKKDAEAVKYYSALADKKVTGKDYFGLYEYLAKHYLIAKDKDQFTRYITLGKELYPTEPMWGQLELAYMQDNSSLTDKVKKYDEAVASGKLTAEEYISYGDLFTSSQKAGETLDSAQIATIRSKAVEAYSKSYALDSSNPVVPFTVGTLLFLNFQDLDDRYRSYAGTTAPLKAKRAEIDNISDGVATKAIEWLEKGYRGMKAKTDRTRTETSYLNRTVDLIANLYAWKRDKAKGKNPKRCRLCTMLNFNSTIKNTVFINRRLRVKM